MERRERTAWVALAVMAAVAAAAALLVSPLGPGITPDGVGYVQAARNLSAGHGYVHGAGAGSYAPTTHWPPFYPVLLSLPARAGLDPLPGARLMGAVLLALTVLLLGWLVRTRTGGSLWAMLFVAAATVCVQPMLWVHTMVLSEPPYMLLSMLALAALAFHMDKPSWHVLALAALAAGAAFMTRYVGLALVATGTLGLVLWRVGTWRQRLRDAALFGAGACLPMALWVVRNVGAARTATDRAITHGIVSRAELAKGVHTVSAWLMPSDLYGRRKLAVTLVLLAAAVAFAVLVAVNRLTGPPEGRQEPRERVLSRLVPLMLLFALLHVVAVLGAMLLTTAPPNLGPRFLIPAFPALLVAITCAVHDQLRAAARRAPAVALFALVAAVCIGVHLHSTVRWGLHNRSAGDGFLSRSWRDSPLLARVAGLPADVPVYCNRGDAVYILTGRRMRGMPWGNDPASVSRQFASIDRALRERGAVVAWFDGVRRENIPSEEAVRAALPLRPIFRAADGTLYGWDGTSSHARQDGPPHSGG